MPSRPPGPLFADLPESMLDRTISAFSAIDAEPGDVLLQQGEVDPAMIVITSGTVEVVRDGTTLDTSTVGETLGEMSFFTGLPRVATVLARDRVEALVLDADGYDQLREDVPEAADELERLVLEHLGVRLRRLDKLIAETAKGEVHPYVKHENPGVLDRVRALLFGSQPEAPVRPKPIFGVEVLYRSKLFREAGEDAISALGEVMRLRAVPKGTFICTQGEPGESLYVLASGTVDVFVSVADGSRIQRLATLSPADSFGMTALVTDGPRMASCVAVEKTDVLELDRGAWNGFLYGKHAGDSAVRCALIRGLARQVDEASRTLLTLPDASARLDMAVKLDIS
jgi:CRP-like cAMP-binding protein